MLHLRESPFYKTRKAELMDATIGDEKDDTDCTTQGWDAKAAVASLHRLGMLPAL